VSFRTWCEARRRRRQTPVDPPAGYHWEVTRSWFTRGDSGRPCWADFWLVEDGMSINDVGVYLDAPDDRIPMPHYRAIVGHPNGLRTATRKLVIEFYEDRVKALETARLRERFRE
jgi:hypothetical protein